MSSTRVFERIAKRIHLCLFEPAQYTPIIRLVLSGHHFLWEMAAALCPAGKEIVNGVAHDSYQLLLLHEPNGYLLVLGLLYDGCSAVFDKVAKDKPLVQDNRGEVTLVDGVQHVFQMAESFGYQVSSRL